MGQPGRPLHREQGHDPDASSLVYEFRSFLYEVAQKVQGPVIIGIDELDKIHDIERAKAMLRDIKGIFDVEGVFFLVSVSDEAKKRLNLGSIQDRDEFNSSFMSVVDLLPNTPSECAVLLEKRTAVHVPYAGAARS